MVAWAHKTTCSLIISLFNEVHVPRALSDLAQMRPCTSEAMRPLTLEPEGGRPGDLHRQSGIHAQEILNCTT